MLSTPIGRMLIALLAVAGLSFSTACEPGTYDDMTQPQETTETETTPQGETTNEPIGGGPVEPSEPGMDMDEDQAMQQPQQDGFDEGLQNIEQGLDNLRQEAENRADTMGENVDQQVESIQQRVQQFEEEIRQDIDDLRQMETEEEPGTGSGPQMEESTEPGMEPDTQDPAGGQEEPTEY